MTDDALNHEETWDTDDEHTDPDELFDDDDWDDEADDGELDLAQRHSLRRVAGVLDAPQQHDRLERIAHPHHQRNEHHQRDQHQGRREVEVGLDDVGPDETLVRPGCPGRG